MNNSPIAASFLGMSLNTPVMGASGTFGFGIEYADFLQPEQIGAIISKGITPLPRAGNPGVRIAETPAGMLNCIGLENPGVEVFKKIYFTQCGRLEGTAHCQYVREYGGRIRSVGGTIGCSRRGGGRSEHFLP